MRLIDADALIERIKETEYIWDGDDDGHKKHDISDLIRTLEISLIEDVPTVDAVEVVMCRDCKWWREEVHGCEMHVSLEPWWDDDWCSYGERRTE